MTPKEAVDKLTAKGFSDYAIAKKLGIQPIMIARYRKELTKTLERSTEEAFLKQFEIVIDY